MNLRTSVFALGVAAAAVASAEYNQTPTGWLYDTNTSIAEFAANEGNNFRATSIQQVGFSGGSPTFATTWVKNTGSHQRDTQVVFNRTAAQLLNDYPGRTMLDVSRYTLNGQTRFAAIFANEVGPWALLYGKSLAAINSYAAAYKVSVVDLDAYTVNGVATYDAVFGKTNPVRPTIAMKVNGFANILDQVNLGWNVIDLQPRVAGE